MSFQDWWKEQSSVDYDEMSVATDAWNYQEQRLLRYKVALHQIATLAELDTTDMSLLTVAKEMQAMARKALGEGE